MKVASFYISYYLLLDLGDSTTEHSFFKRIGQWILMGVLAMLVLVVVLAVLFSKKVMRWPAFYISYWKQGKISIKHESRE